MPRSTEGPKEQRPGGKVSSTYRLSPDSLRRLAVLKTQLNMPKSAVLELAILGLAEKRGVA